MTEVRTFPQGPHDKKRNRRIFLTVSALLAVVTLLVANEVLLPFVLGLLVAYIFLPIVLRIQKRGVPRFAAILIVYVLALGMIAGFIALIVPSLLVEGRALRRDLPKQIEDAQAKWVPVLDEKIRAWKGADAEPVEEPAPLVPEGDPAADPHAGPNGDAPILISQRPDGKYEVKVSDQVVFQRVGEDTWKVQHVERDKTTDTQAFFKKMLERGTKYFSENTVELLKLGQRIVSAITRGIFNLFMTLMLGAYIMLTHEKIIGFFRELFATDSQASFDRLFRRLDRGLSGVVRGQLLICLVNGVLSAIGFWIFDLKYWPLMALLAAVGSLIPIFGSILSSIPAVAIALTQSPSTALFILAWIVGIHQLEANFLNPKIIGDAAKIHPVLVVFSLLVGEHFFQIKGALFAVPCMSIVQTIFLHFRETTMGLRDPTETAHPPPPPPASDRGPPANEIPPGVNRS